MSNRNVFYMTIGVIIAIVVLIIVNLISMYWNPNPAVYIGHNDIRGMAVQQQGKLWTLNFTQQNEVLDLLNRSVLVSPIKPNSMMPPDFEKLVIYRFENQPDIELKPIILDTDNNYTFSAPLFSQTEYLKDISSGAMYELISKTYDKQ